MQEANLAAAGHGDVVLASRRAVQDGVSEALIAGVQAITGRTVIAFLSADSLVPDMAVETFICSRWPARDWRPIDGPEMMFA